MNEAMELIVGYSDQAESGSGSIQLLTGFMSSEVNYFALAAALVKGKIPSAPLPHRTFAVGDAAFHLRRDPLYWHVTIEEVAKTYNLPDLLAALVHYAHRVTSGHLHHSVGGHWQLTSNASLPFNAVDIWTTMQIQGKAYHYPHDPLPPQTINVVPASALPGWLHRRHNPVVINIDPSLRWPRDGLKGKSSLSVSQILALI